jgi:hypothetical protein
MCFLIQEVGLSLLAASVNYWIARGKTGCPHVFVSSHFHALIGLLADDAEILSFHVSFDPL